MIAVKSCVLGKGYELSFELEPGGGFRVEWPTIASREEMARQRAAVQECTKQVDPARLEPPELSDKQLELMYAYIQAQVSCMREAGYPAADPPPLQVYKDTDGAWEPYSDLRRRGVDFAHEHLVQCQSVEEMPDFLQ